MTGSFWHFEEELIVGQSKETGRTAHIRASAWFRITLVTAFIPLEVSIEKLFVRKKLSRVVAD